MTRNIARAAGALFACAALAGCSALGRQAFTPPEIGVKDVRLSGVGLQGGRVDVVLSLYNPNDFRLDAEAINYRVHVDTLKLGEGTIAERVSLERKDSTEVAIPVMFNLREVLSAGSLLAQRGTLEFRVSGDVRVLTPFGAVTRQFEQRGKYDGVSISIDPRRK